MKRIVVLLVALLSTNVFAASTPLDRFFSDVYTFRAAFNQVVLDESLNIVQEASGELYLQRPDKFRWDYGIPFEQHIVSDGADIWVYDVELKQATVRKHEGALGNTPAVLLAGRGRLKDNFDVKPLGKQGTLNWFQMTPKKNDGGYETIRLGFEGNDLRMLEMHDSFGQTTRVSLREGRENRPIDKKMFRFTPPRGVDVVRE